MLDILNYAAVLSALYLGLGGVVAYTNNRPPSPIAFGVLWLIAFLTMLEIAL